MPTNVTIVPASHMREALSNAAAWPGAWTFRYFGARYQTYVTLTRLVPANGVVRSCGAELAQAAQGLSGALINLEETQFADDADRAWWDASDLGDRGPYATRLLETAAQVALFRQWLDGSEQQAVVVDDDLLARLLYRDALDVGHRAGWGVPGRTLPVVQHFRAALNVAQGLLHQVRQHLSGVRYYLRMLRTLRRERKSTPLPLAQLRACDTVMVTWSGKAVFPADNPLEVERYFGRLPKILRAGGASLGFAANSAIGEERVESVVANAVAARSPTFMVEDGFTLGKVFKAALLSLTVPWRVKTDVSIAGFGLKPVLRFERQRMLATWRPMQSLLAGEVGAFLARHGLHPKTVVHTYENQPWEKMLRAGLRKHLPQTKIVACQHVPLAPLFISIHPSRREIARGLLVDRLMLTGEHFIDMFRDNGFPAQRLAVGGTLRFEDLVRPARGVHQRAQGSLRVLCSTSIDYEESLELAHKVVMASLGVDGVTVVVNFHPALPEGRREQLKQTLREYAGEDLTHVSYSTASSGTLLEEADVLTYNTSSAAFDALAQKCPVLNVQRENGLDYDRVPEPLAHRARSIDEIRTFFERCVAGEVSDVPYETLARAIAPVDEDAFVDAVRTS